MMRRVIGWVLGVAIMVVAGGASAAESTMAGADVTDRTMMQYNVYPAFEKLGRGLGNIVGGWLEIPYQIDQRYTARNTAASIFAGTFIGVIKGVGRTLVGAYETVTFWLPLPEHFAPILPTLPYFDKAEPRQPLLLE